MTADGSMARLSALGKSHEKKLPRKDRQTLKNCLLLALRMVWDLGDWNNPLGE